MGAINRIDRGRMPQAKKALEPKTYYGIKRTIVYFTDKTLRYASVAPILDDHDEPPAKQETRRIIDGREFITWFASEKKRDAILKKIKEGFFLGWEPIKV
jgi:hypothetical protein